jgi:hypothetical protein
LPPAPPTPITVMRGFSSSTWGGPISMLIDHSPTTWRQRVARCVPMSVMHD